MPDTVRVAVESALGAEVVGEQSQTGGFSPGMASRLQFADGRWVFVKAVSAGRDRRAPELYRREVRVMAGLPAAAPAPRLRWSYDDGDWVALVLDDIEGRSPAQPWTEREFRRVLGAVGELADALTPAPGDAMAITDDPELIENFRSWRTIGRDPALVEQLDGWARARLARLVELETGWPDAAMGKTLAHLDLRADNLLLTSDRGVVFVDWAYAAAAAPFVDGLLLVTSVAATSDIDPQEVWAEFRPAAAADPDAVTVMLAAVAGDFLYQSMLPAPTNLPALREHQRAKGRAALSWLRRRIS